MKISRRNALNVKCTAHTVNIDYLTPYRDQYSKTFSDFGSCPSPMDKENQKTVKVKLDDIAKKHPDNLKIKYSGK